jgi:hypothetical protein
LVLASLGFGSKMLPTVRIFPALTAEELGFLIELATETSATMPVIHLPD